MSEPEFFRFEWLDGEGIAGPELAATFARLEITIDGLCATRAFDRRARTVRDAIFVPLYPIAEWVAEHYWRLLAEPANRAGSPSFRHAHDLSSADLGYALPRLRIHPEGAEARVPLEPRRGEHLPIELVGAGERRVATDSLRAELRNLMTAVAERLATTGPPTTRLHYLLDRRDAEESDPEMAAFCRLTAALGFDPDRVPDEVAESIERAGDRLPVETLEDLCTSIDPSTLGEGTAWVTSTQERIQRIEPEAREGAQQFAEALRAAGRKVGRDPSLLPWDRGYRTARAVRELVEADERKGVPVEHLVARLGLADRVVDVPRIDKIAALTGVGEEGVPRIAVTPRTEAGRRFAIARALFDFIATGARVPRLATRAETERQKAGRAFAAELLAPAEAIARRLPADRRLQPEDLDDLAAEFGVSSWVVAHQIEHHGLATIVP